MPAPVFLCLYIKWRKNLQSNKTILSFHTPFEFFLSLALICFLYLVSFFFFLFHFIRSIAPLLFLCFLYLVSCYLIEDSRLRKSFDW